MSLVESLGIQLRFREAISLGLAVSLVAVFVIMPRAMVKLRGAGIVGRDRHKAGRPEVPEMGGLAIFLAFNTGVFCILALANVPPAEQTVVLASLVVAAGAAVTGVLDDLVELRQRFKAFIPLAFAAPLALYVPDAVVSFPLVGPIDFGLLYPLVLVPLGIACASNGFNMLEGFNGLGAGVGVVLASALSVIAILSGNLAGLVLLFPLLGALATFLVYNWTPARIFPGDTMTLLVGAILAAAAILSKIEFWGLLLFVPHIVEFMLKAKGNFAVQSFANRQDGDKLGYEGPIRSLTHVVMRGRMMSEQRIVLTIIGAELLLAVAVVGLYVVLG